MLNVVKLNVTNKAFMLSVIILCVVMLIAVARFLTQMMIGRISK
jgi:hypothetical protein